MNTHILKLFLLSCLLFQAGCDITFKRKAPEQNVVKEKADKKIKNISKNKRTTLNDSKIIRAFYSDVANSITRKNIILHTEISNKEQKKILIGKYVNRNIQVVPLPLNLEKKLSVLSLSVIRVQIGTRVILMDVKSRLILDVVKI